MRQRIALCAALALLTVCATAQAATVSVLYKRDSQASLERLDPAAQAALQAMEDKLIESGSEVIQPKAELYALLDQAKGVVLNFNADAGLTLTIDAAKGSRPNPGADATWAEVRLRAKLYSGRRVLASLSGFGAVAYRGQAQDRALEVAAKRAVDDLSAKLLRTLDDAPPPPPPAPSLVVPPGEPAPAQAVPAKGAKWALMMGVSDFTHIAGFESGDKDLPGVEVDMRAVRDALTALGVTPDRMTWLYNDKATTAGLRKALKDLEAKTRPEDMVYVYFSTHGIPKAEGYSRFGIPVTYDFRQDNFVDFEQVRNSLATMPAGDIIWINDTCHSGLAAEGLVTVEVGARDFGIGAPASFDASRAADIRVKKNIAVMSSASGSQQAADLGEKGGLFSSVFAGAAGKVAASGETIAAYSFYKQYIDGSVQAGFHTLCTGPAQPDICAQKTQQPVFGAQHDGKRIGM